MKISSILCTYGRFHCVQRSIGMWLNQDFLGEKELIIFNTSEHPFVIGDKLQGMANVHSIHAPRKTDGTNYGSLGEVRNEALKYATGDLYSCWDDDDLFLPFHLSQSYERYMQANCLAWKPKHSLFSNDGGKTFKLAGNAMEASILADMAFVRKHKFSTNQSGAEHVQGGWLDKLKKNEFVIEEIRPSYAYVWGDGLHKTSGSIDNPNNFENHKTASEDFGIGKALIPATEAELKERFKAAYEWT